MTFCLGVFPLNAYVLLSLLFGRGVLRACAARLLPALCLFVGLVVLFDVLGRAFLGCLPICPLPRCLVSFPARCSGLSSRPLFLCFVASRLFFAVFFFPRVLLGFLILFPLLRLWFVQSGSLPMFVFALLAYFAVAGGRVLCAFVVVFFLGFVWVSLFGPALPVGLYYCTLVFSLRRRPWFACLCSCPVLPSFVCLLCSLPCWPLSSHFPFFRALAFGPGSGHVPALRALPGPPSLGSLSPRPFCLIGVFVSPLLLAFCPPPCLSFTLSPSSLFFGVWLFPPFGFSPFFACFLLWGRCPQFCPLLLCPLCSVRSPDLLTHPSLSPPCFGAFTLPVRLSPSPVCWP